MEEVPVVESEAIVDVKSGLTRGWSGPLKVAAAQPKAVGLLVERSMGEVIREPVRVLFHLNGYTKVVLERMAGVGLADGGIVWDISTEIIPVHLRKIGSRFIVSYTPLNSNEESNLDSIRAAKNRLEIEEV